MTRNDLEILIENKIQSLLENLLDIRTDEGRISVEKTKDNLILYQYNSVIKVPNKKISEFVKTMNSALKGA